VLLEHGLHQLPGWLPGGRAEHHEHVLPAPAGAAAVDVPEAALAEGIVELSPELVTEVEVGEATQPVLAGVQQGQ
jgi:hypothetical protein